MKRRQFLRAVTAACSASAVGMPALASAAEIDAVLAKIKAARSTIRTLQAGFTQKRSIGLLATAVESKGTLSLVLPDRLRWELFAPDAVTYWVGPSGLAIRTEEGVTKVGAASAGRFASVLGDLLVMLGGDIGTLRTRYELTARERDDGVRISAKPKAPEVAKHIRRLRLRTGKEIWAVRRVAIEETSGDSSIITFGAFTKNAPIPPAYMKP